LANESLTDTESISFEPVELSSLAPQLLEPARAYPGALIVVEGIDGSGKSTQLYLLKRWLEIGGLSAAFHGVEFISAREIGDAARKAAPAC